MLSSLSKPQKVLVWLSVAILIAFIGLTGLILSLSSGGLNLPNISLPDISLPDFSGKNIKIKDIASGTVTEAGYNQKLEISNSAEISWPETKLLALANSKLTINANKIVLEAGAVLVVRGQEKLTINDWELSNAIGALLQPENTLYVFKGRATSKDAILVAGKSVELATNQINTISRREVINIPSLASLRAQANLISADLPWLTDINAPKLLTLSPQPQSIVSESKVTLAGTTDDVLAQIKVNGAEATNTNGKFSLDLNLLSGDNTILINLTDLYGNTYSSQFVVTYAPGTNSTASSISSSVTSTTSSLGSAGTSAASSLGSSASSVTSKVSSSSSSSQAGGNN